ncbi:hypothetical protein Syun_018977 [Stephania yunnanensis]|uniref:Uncharacterized protein n=1 Tax=Stephania yunnanensis TaxID=152371 RepID=A0AAP0NXI4_9MAGN
MPPSSPKTPTLKATVNTLVGVVVVATSRRLAIGVTASPPLSLPYIYISIRPSSHIAFVVSSYSQRRLNR